MDVASRKTSRQLHPFILAKKKKSLKLSLSFSLYFLIASLGLFVCLSILLQFFSRKNGRIAFSLLSIQLELDCAGDPKVQHHYFNNNSSIQTDPLFLNLCGYQFPFSQHQRVPHALHHFSLRDKLVKEI